MFDEVAREAKTAKRAKKANSFFCLFRPLCCFCFPLTLKEFAPRSTGAVCKSAHGRTCVWGPGVVACTPKLEQTHRSARTVCAFETRPKFRMDFLRLRWKNINQC